MVNIFSCAKRINEQILNTSCQRAQCRQEAVLITRILQAIVHEFLVYRKLFRPTLGPKVAVILGDLRRFKATLGNLVKTLRDLRRFKATLGDLRRKR